MCTVAVVLDVVVVLCRDVPVVLVLLAAANAEPTTYAELCAYSDEKHEQKD